MKWDFISQPIGMSRSARAAEHQILTRHRSGGIASGFPNGHDVVPVDVLRDQRSTDPGIHHHLCHHSDCGQHGHHRADHRAMRTKPLSPGWWPSSLFCSVRFTLTVPVRSSTIFPLHVGWPSCGRLSQVPGAVRPDDRRLCARRYVTAMNSKPRVKLTRTRFQHGH